MQLLFNLTELNSTELVEEEEQETCFTAADCQTLLDVIHTVQEPQIMTPPPASPTSNTDGDGGLGDKEVDPVRLWRKVSGIFLGL